MQRDTVFHDDVENTVDEMIARLGNDLRVGMPLGLGKPNQLINALYQRAKSNSELKLTIITALSLEKPTAKTDVEQRFLGPFLQRVFGDCPDLDYVVDMRKKRLPSNVSVKEFFFKPGAFLKNQHAQHNYISSNYTHAARDVFENGCNVAMQVIAKRKVADGHYSYSLSCNPDTGPELIELLEEAGRPHMVIGQVNSELPFMYNDAEVAADTFDVVVENKAYNTKLFGTPKLSVQTPDYLIGMQASALIKDGGTLQVGIGALGDAIVYGAQLRHQHNDVYKRVLERTGIAKRSVEIIERIGGTEPFKLGLYGATEMFVDGFIHLYKSGILKRRVYDFWALQQLINSGKVNPENLQADVFSDMESLGVRVLRTKDFDRLQFHGFFNDECSYDAGYIVAPNGDRILANVGDPEAREQLAEHCLGERLRNGIVIHGGFFLGPNDFYQSLNDMSEEERRLICMTGVYKVNQLDHNPRLYKAQRKDARFINTGVMATLNGGVVSDGLENGQVISGVGGQYNFVAMGHQLPTGRSILMVRSVREKDGVAVSNIVFNYGYLTIPRHLRDIVITEYGIAVLRSKTDSECMQAMICVADSRFQADLLAKAKENGKIPADWEVPAEYRNNTPARLNEALKEHKALGMFPAFPFGTDFTQQELDLAGALKGIKARVGGKKLPIRAILDSWKVKTIPEKAKPYLKRMDLLEPDNFQHKLVQRLLVLELKEAGKI